MTYTSFRMPVAGSKAAELLGDMETIVEILHPKNAHRLPVFGDALRQARRDFPTGAKAILMVCLRDDDERWLISVGSKGGWKRVWNFGRGEPVKLSRAA